MMLFWGLHLLIVASVCTTEGGCAGDNDTAYWYSPVFTLSGTLTSYSSNTFSGPN